MRDLADLELDRVTGGELQTLSQTLLERILVVVCPPCFPVPAEDYSK
jgi:hypothetical protein